MNGGIITWLGCAMALSWSVPAAADEPSKAHLRNAEDIFSEWVNPTCKTAQHLWEDVDLSAFWQRNTRALINQMNTLCNQEPDTYAFLKPLLAPPGSSKQGAFELEDSKQQHKLFQKLYEKLDKDPDAFVGLLLKSGLATVEQNKREKKAPFLRSVERYTEWSKLLFYDKDRDLCHQYRFCWANRLFSYVFGKGFKRMRAMMDNPAHYPVLRVLYTSIWHPLAGIGWKEGSRESLKAVAREAKKGKTVVYPAGGCDIYNLLMAGVYNIYVIDPVLPSQPKYYVDDWNWFVGGDDDEHCIGDIMQFPHGITLTRSLFNKQGKPFKVEGSDGAKHTIEPSVTMWRVTDKKGNKLGNVTYDRRFCTQADFNVSKDKVLYMSFNELYFITCADGSGWGIDPHKFDGKLKIYIKQLHKPVSKRMMCNMYAADDSAFSFIRLGSCVT